MYPLLFPEVSAYLDQFEISVCPTRVGNSTVSEASEYLMWIQGQCLQDRTTSGLLTAPSSQHAVLPGHLEWATPSNPAGPPPSIVTRLDCSWLPLGPFHLNLPYSIYPPHGGAQGSPSFT